MNEKERRPNPDETGQFRPKVRPPGALPERAAQREAENTQSGSGLGGANAGPDPTIALGSTESYTPERSGPSEDPAQVPGTVILAAPKPVAPKEGQVIANRFVVRKVLGQGGMGRVYAVQDRNIEGRDVALKVLLPKYSKSARFRKLFFQEVRSAQEFVSEYICQIRDTGETEDGSLFFTMDQVEGESLRALLDREKLLGPRQALEITRQVLLGLHSGHEKGYVHRDIKPSNVMLAARIAKTDTNPYGVGVRLLDFGIAALATEIDETSRAGTVMYMSPEQASGERLDPRSDLFAVGVLLFEMLSGHRPFDGSTTRALVQSVLETNLTARLGEIPNLSKPIRKLLERALQKDRNKRFQSATDFADEIGRSAAYKLPKEVPGWAYAGLGVLFLAAAAEGYMLKQQSSELANLNQQVGAAAATRLQAVQEAERLKDIDIRSQQAKLQELERERDKWRTDFGAADAARINADAARIKAESTVETMVAAEASRSADKTQDTTQFDDLIGQLETFRTDNSLIKAKLHELELSEEQWKARAAAAEKARDEALRAASPQGQLAMTFDRICELVEKDLGKQALFALQQAQDTGVFAKAGVDAADTVASLAHAAERVHVYRESVSAGTPPALRDVVDASRFLDIAEKGAETLAVEGAVWVDFQFAGQEVQDRPKRARELAEALRKVVVEALASSEKEDSRAAAAIDLSTVSRDAKAIFAHADRFGCKGHLARAAELVVDQLRQQAAPGNVLQMDKLRGFSTLPEFVKRVEQGQFTLDESRTADLYAFELAQRWYSEGARANAIDWKFARPSVPTAPTTDWRQIMYLQWQLSQESANFPIKKGRTQFYRLLESNKNLAWGRSSSLNNSRTDVETQTFDAEGYQKDTASATKFEFLDGTLRIQGSNVMIVDLHSLGEGLSVVPFPPIPEQPAVPESLASEAELRKFRDYVKSHPLACIVVGQNTSRTRWLSPEFGLVFDDNVGILRRELVYATGVQ